MSDIPQYQCHKKVLALKIIAIEFNKDGGAKIAAKEFVPLLLVNEFKSKFKGDENDLGYWVQYEDGYISWSPTKAFEEGYSKC